MDFQVIHVSVDGSLRNLNVLAAAIVLLVGAAILTVVAGVFVARHNRVVAAILISALAVLFLVSQFLLLRLSWLAQTLTSQRPVSTTFFYPPPGWLPCAVGVSLGLIVSIVLGVRTRRRMQHAV